MNDISRQAQVQEYTNQSTFVYVGTPYPSYISTIGDKDITASNQFIPETERYSMNICA